MEKIGINIVGLGTVASDHSSRLYNVGEGFRNVTGKIVCTPADSIYLLVTSDRAYEVTVEGDLVLAKDATENGVTPFDVDWNEAVKASGNGKGKITIVNPDAPSDVSTFEVSIGETASVEATFNDVDACYACVNLEGADVSVVDPAIKAVLSAPKEVNPYELGLVFVDSMNAALGLKSPGDLLDRVVLYDFTDIGSLPAADALSHEFGHTPRIDPLTDRFERQDHAELVHHSIPLMLLRDDLRFDPNYHRPEDYCAHAPSAECDLIDALLFGRSTDVGGPALVRATLEDLMASFGEDGGIGEIAVNNRDFGQLARTRKNDLERIERAVIAANDLGIDTSNVASRRDAALEKLVVLSDRFESGGTHDVTETEVAVINEVFGDLWSIHSDLDKCVSHWHHYKQHEANHDRWEARLAERKRNFKLGADAQDNRIATSYVGYAANPDETLKDSKASFAELFQAIQRGDLGAAHKADQKARQFSTREHLLDRLISRGALVVAEESVPA